ncbi:MAG: hypothetical protein UX49_C0038G0012 [Candidatus Wolfebacteria bacterium GW2011_GWC2_46_275]|uniref:Uncharacterized protein n=1 Tax=Candidatus Wolfebacteria bacterium GW2011_GWA2_47_9b TaxID=1619005 RepID=A0A0G1U8J5_9BACT|nr:MAG: hypothetical protein UX49_C0038G0012 [Candidatus Wolfebacteria bacterium GW2011_GWC2_46_275]KKU70950.1 MAG: hypothetical protein UX96_C0031G0010 [Candidatus Wolfebacteria bacterium GW2011_GWB1_47_243]KKU90399.1 MAG: hypothetical protein UY19_C0003G0054 [Candidatus Wolfebacteria bacterium GW2011_GWA2_47_9b]
MHAPNASELSKRKKLKQRHKKIDLRVDFFVEKINEVRYGETVQERAVV